ncbi:MAG TPA: TIGR02270 family protein [Archangium sp.]|nr:TIGR02270 family protein [Archangium sp.]
MFVHTEQPLRWDIYEEHLDEAAFRWSQWEAALDAPDYVLAEVAELEERVASHLDGLVLGGERVARRLLEPSLAADEAERIVVAALALLNGEASSGSAAVRAALAQAEAPALAAYQRALELAVPSRGVSLDLLPLLTKEEVAPEFLALVLDTLGSHGLATAPLCLSFLTHPEPLVAAAALRVAGRMRLPLEPGVLQRALESDQSILRDAAIVAGLLGGYRGAWAACQVVAESRSPDAQLPLLLLAMGGNEREMNRLLGLLSDESLRPRALWALGFSGSTAAAEACLEWMRLESTAALAGEAFSAITGLRIEGEYAAVRQEPVAEEPIPLEQEDLDADLVPKPEDALPLPQADAVASWWMEARRRMDVRMRYLSGQPFTAQVLLDALVSAPMRRRHALALDLALRSRGALHVPTRAFMEHQLAALQQARSAAPSSFSRPFAEALRG